MNASSLGGGVTSVDWRSDPVTVKPVLNHDFRQTAHAAPPMPPNGCVLLYRGTRLAILSGLSTGIFYAFLESDRYRLSRCVKFCSLKLFSICEEMSANAPAIDENISDGGRHSYKWYWKSRRRRQTTSDAILISAG